jgi:predicted TIM-barrel fold metal-dependent hydrolase
MLVIDGHAHAAGAFFKAETLTETLDSLHVDKVCLAPMGVDTNGVDYSEENMNKEFGDGDHDSWIEKFIEFLSHLKEEIYQVPNEYLYQLKQSCPDRIIQFYWANPKDPAVMDLIENNYQQWNYSGVKLQQMFSDFDTDQESMHQISEFCASKDMPLFIHLFTKQHVKQFVNLVKAHPTTKYIVGHLIGYEYFAKKIRNIPNYWFDISPPMLVPDKWVHDALSVYGSGRLILGSDTPFGKDGLKNNIARVLDLQCTANDKDLILGGNMQDLLNL